MTGNTRPTTGSLLSSTLYFHKAIDHNTVVKYSYIKPHFTSFLYHLILLSHLKYAFHPGRTPLEYMTMFNNKANTMDFYIMIKDFFIH